MLTKKRVLGIVLATVLVLSLGLVFAGPIGASPGPGIAGLWHLDEGSGGTAADSSGNGNDGVLRMGTALNFDGTDDYVEVPDSSSLDITDEITIEAWINPSTLGGYQYIVSKRGLDYYANYGLRLNGQKLEFYYNGPNAGVAPYDWNVWQTTSNVISTTGLWYHVAVAFTFNSDGSITCYVNGTSVSGSWLSGPEYGNGTDPAGCFG